MLDGGLSDNPINFLIKTVSKVIIGRMVWEVDGIRIGMISVEITTYIVMKMV